MKIKDLYTPGRTVFSLEVFPPNKNFPIETVYDAIEGLAAINPAYISVTYGAGGNRANRSTCEIASHIKEKYGIESMAHLTCINSTRDDVDFMLDDFAANGIENARFICADAGKAAEKLLGEGKRPEVIVLDPPRKGCSEQTIRAAAKMAPDRIVYVSCDPATLARDCAVFKELGYEVEEATPVDLFPRTAHVETVCLLSRAI